MLHQYKFTIECPKCARKRVISVPSDSLERANELMEEVITLLDHPKYPIGSVKKDECKGKFKITQEDKTSISLVQPVKTS